MREDATLTLALEEVLLPPLGAFDFIELLLNLLIDLLLSLLANRNMFDERGVRGDSVAGNNGLIVELHICLKA